jgi:hypothetical protein
MPRHAPFNKETAAEYGRMGGVKRAADRAAKEAADPRTRGLLGELLTYTTTDWMERLGLTGSTWSTWKVIGKVLDGLPLTTPELETYRTLTGRSVVPTDLREVLVLAGGGSGKTTFMAVQAIKAACRSYDVRGIARVLLLGFVKEHAGIAYEMDEQFVDGDRELRKLVTSRTRSEMNFAHGVRLQTIASNYRQVRGYSIAAALLDEVAFWWNDDTNANPDVEIVRALRPRLGKVPGSRLLAITTPWTEEGWAFDTHERHYGNDASNHVLVVKAPTMVLNPSFDAARIAIEEAEDPESAAAEYGAQWRVAGGSLVRPDAYDACVSKDVSERAPEPPLGDDVYLAAVDLSGGTGQDSAALSICHTEDQEAGGDLAVQDLIREWMPPFDPGVMVTDLVAELRRYQITEVVGDQFSAGFAGAEFRRHGIEFTVSERKTNECLLDSLAIINTKRARLLDHPKLRKQWLNLKRDYASGGRPTVIERAGKHDDLAVVTARGIVALLGLGIEETGLSREVQMSKKPTPKKPRKRSKTADRLYATGDAKRDMPHTSRAVKGCACMRCAMHRRMARQDRLDNLMHEATQDLPMSGDPIWHTH